MTPVSFFVSLSSSDTFSNGGGKYQTKNWILNIKESEIFKEISNALKMRFFFTNFPSTFWGVCFFM